jgi:flagellar assembly protein FliH
MKSLIKGGGWPDVDDVRPVDWGSGASIRIETPVRTSTAPNSTTSRLEQEIEILRGALAAAETRHKQDVTAKVEHAREETTAYHRRRDEDALTALSNALGEASTETLEKLGSAERLALLLCDAALARLFSDAAAQKDLLVRAIRRQVEQLRSELILSVRVSAADFPESASLQALRRILGGQFDIKQDHGLSAGSCRIDLRLGHIDLSLPAHWAALQSELRRLAALEGLP